MLPMIEPGERGLDDLRLARAQGHEGDDQLRGVAEGRVQQAADAGPGVVGDVLGGLAHEAGQGQDGEAADDEDPGRRGVGQPQVDGHGHEDEQEPEDVACP